MGRDLIKAFILSLFLMSGFSIQSAHAYKVNGVRCKDMPKRSCQRKMCRCFRGVHRVNKGKPIKRQYNKKGKPTIQFVCAQNAQLGPQGAWAAFLQSKPKLARRCGGAAF